MKAAVNADSVPSHKFTKQISHLRMCHLQFAAKPVQLLPFLHSQTL